MTRLRPRPWLAVLFGMLCTVATGAQDGLLEQARAQADHGDLGAALESVEQFLAGQPKDERGRFLRGVLLVESGRSDEAIAEFDALVEDHPELPEPYNNLAVLYAARGQYAEARDALLRAINTHPSYTTAHENLGDIYAKLAGIAYDRALSLDDSNVAARAKLALVHELFSNAIGPVNHSVGAGTVVAAAPSAAPEPQPAAPQPPVPPQPVVTAAASPPAAIAAPPATDPAAELAVRDTVLAWAAAWSAKDADGYLGYYGRDFRPPGGVAISAWQVERRGRIDVPRFIDVGIDNLDVQMNGVDRARATFTQRYRSDTFGDRVRKVLGLARESGGWRIVSEVSD